MTDTRLVVVVTILHGNITTPEAKIGSSFVTVYPVSGRRDIGLDEVLSVRPANACEVAAYEDELAATQK